MCGRKGIRHRPINRKLSYFCGVLENLRVAQPVKNQLSFYINRIFIAFFRTFRHWILSYATLIQSKTSHHFIITIRVKSMAKISLFQD